MAAISGRGKGGTARAKALSKARRSAIAKKAAAARMTALTPERRSEIATNAVAAREAKRAVAVGPKRAESRHLFQKIQVAPGEAEQCMKS